MMLTSIWTRRLIWTAASFSMALILERTLASPLWAIGGLVALLAFGYWRIGREGLLEKVVKLDHETSVIVRLVALTIVFFIESVIAAWLVIHSTPTTV